MEEIKMECEHCGQMFLPSELMRDRIGIMICDECNSKIELKKMVRQNRNEISDQNNQDIYWSQCVNHR
jgi:uncharacterized Zn finger protein